VTGAESRRFPATLRTDVDTAQAERAPFSLSGGRLLSKPWDLADFVDKLNALIWLGIALGFRHGSSHFDRLSNGLVRQPAGISLKASNRACRPDLGAFMLTPKDPRQGDDGVAAPHKLDGLIAWTRHDEWCEPLARSLERHTAQACEAAEIDQGEIEDLLGAYAATTIWGAAFEDLLATDLPDGRNLAEEYLRRRGWKESAATREYITGLRHSVISLYEVSGLVPGESMLLRDLIRGGAPIRVMEKSGSRGLRAHPGTC
jgi:hypothetical protein